MLFFLSTNEDQTKIESGGIWTRKVKFDELFYTATILLVQRLMVNCAIFLLETYKANRASFPGFIGASSHPPSPPSLNGTPVCCRWTARCRRKAWEKFVAKESTGVCHHILPELHGAKVLFSPINTHIARSEVRTYIPRPPAGCTKHWAMYLQSPPYINPSMHRTL